MSPSPLLAALTVWTLTYMGACTTALVRAFRASPRSERHENKGSLSSLTIRPCAGSEPYLVQTLHSSPQGSRVAFAVASETDGAFPVVTDLACATGAHVHLTGARGLNQKAQQIAFVLSHEAPSEVVVVCDSDVLLHEDDIATLLAPLVRDSRVVASWAAPAEVLSSATFGDHVSASVLGGSLHAFPLLAGIDPSGMVGKLFAVRRDALEKIGGFGALAAFLGEDMELARRLRAQGEVVFCRKVLACSHASQRSLRDTLDRFTRWIHVIRAQRPWLLIGYPLVLAAWPLLALASIAIAVVVPNSQFIALANLLLATSTRAAVGWSARRLVRRTEGSFASDMVLSDLALLVAFVRALSSRRVTWRGNSLLFGKGGALQ